MRIWRGDAELDAGPRQQRCLLALLLTREGLPITMGDLIDLVWGPESPTSAVNVIHKYIGMLRRLLEPDLALRSAGSYLLRHGNGYRFTAGPETLDLVAFRHAVARAKSHLGQDRPEEALGQYVEALRCCHGSTADGLADSSPAVATFARIDSEFFDAAVAAAEIALRVGRPAQILAPLKLAADLGRLSEPVHASLVTALSAAGHQAEALATYRRIRERLAEELGIDPGSDLQEAQRRALTPVALTPVALTPVALTPVALTAAGPRPAPELPLDSATEAVPAPLVRPAQLPPDLSLFVGRTAELALLGDLVAARRDERRSGPLVVAIDGMGGVGKSTVAVHFAHLVADQFTDGQLYLDLRGHLGEEASVPVADALRSLLYALGVRGSDVPDTFDALIGVYRSLTVAKRILVLLDNVRDPSHVRPLLPNSPDCLVLVTSRHPQLGLAVFDGARLVSAGLPDLPQARELIERRLAVLKGRAFDSGADAALLDEIIELCGRLPLAMAILAARLAARPRLSLDTVAAELRDGANLLEAFSGGHGLNDPRTAFSWSYRHLSPGTARLFRLLSVAPSPGVTADACVSLAGQDREATRAQLKELTEAALVAEQGNGRYASHVLIKAYAEELFQATESPEQRREAVSRLLDFYLQSSSNAQTVLEPGRVRAVPPPRPGVEPTRPATYAEAIDWFANEREALKESVRLAVDIGYGIVPWQLAITMQQYLNWAGYYQDWEDVMRTALHGAREQGDTVGEAHVRRSLSGARYSLGAHDEALGLLAGSLETYQQLGMRREQALVHTNYHRIYGALGRHERALAHSNEALCLHRALGDRRAEVANLMGNSRSLAGLGRLEESAFAMEQALEVVQKSRTGLEEGEIRIAIAYNLAGIGHTQQAVRQLELSAGRSRELGSLPNEFDALRQLMDLLIMMGDATGARRVFHRARAVLEALRDDAGPSL
ncbi:AfsR/SARP family transcriptional regulator [Winogradskya consettensis]|uniref:AfsR/SARP family transcriptional regulator n=1 Tax=Winogradskya consettensis TaxID=113560 RepID=UPI001FD00C1A|nr:BTAD domain-containing putative transcriptional regulator [Actinoplanes consettensis]